eukprot:6502238-Pyramimonas_sp.AAC.1
MQCADALGKRKESMTTKATKELVALLSSPLEQYDVVRTLSLQNYPRVMDLLTEDVRKDVAVTIVRTILKNGTVIGDVSK